MAQARASGALKIKNSLGDTVFNVINITLFVIFTLICIYPFYYLLINTVSANDLSANGQIIFYPQHLQIQNYIEVIKLPGLLNAAVISIGRTVIGSTFTVFASAFLGYLFTQKMWGRKFWYRFIVVTMYFNAGLIPWYITMMNLHLTNNFMAYILPAIVQPFNIILVKTYIESTPASLQEAAQIDGAGFIRIFWSVMLPLIKPILATIAIFAAVGQWNSFTDTLILMTDQRLYTLQYTLYQYINQASSLAALVQQSQNPTQIANLVTQQTPTSIQMTVSIITVLPILLVYPFFQRFFVKGIMIGAVKG
jgi:putative aldouronate transport system permease protein